LSREANSESECWRFCNFPIFWHPESKHFSLKILIENFYFYRWTVHSFASWCALEKCFQELLINNHRKGSFFEFAQIYWSLAKISFICGIRGSSRYGKWCNQLHNWKNFKTWKVLNDSKTLTFIWTNSYEVSNVALKTKSSLVLLWVTLRCIYFSLHS
jgi:hypothetical protein